MEYLNYDLLNSITRNAFRSAKPFPWINPASALTDSGFAALHSALPDISLFEKRFGYNRDHGQKGHDRYSLEYDESLDIDPKWHEFVAELKGPAYRSVLRRLLGFRPMKLSFHWHYTPSGCAVSPHCDSQIKLGSHIFYFNTEDDWQQSWGGETVVLDDHGKLDCKSAPSFSELDETACSRSIGNYSLIFMRTPHSWHGVRAVNCPKGKLRKVFIIVVERVRPVKTIRNLIREKLSGKTDQPNQAV